MDYSFSSPGNAIFIHDPQQKCRSVFNNSDWVEFEVSYTANLEMNLKLGLSSERPSSAAWGLIRIMNGRNVFQTTTIPNSVLELGLQSR